MINSLCEVAYSVAKLKGWYSDNIQTGTSLALIHSEVSEALEADRVGNRELFEEELADICIRVFSLCGHMNIDLEKRIVDKMVDNYKRPYKHGGKLY